MKSKPQAVDPGPLCGSCRFYKEQTETADEIRWGICRRFPPAGVSVPDADGSYGDDAVWAPVRPDEWCGEFKAGQ